MTTYQEGGLLNTLSVKWMRGRSRESWLSNAMSTRMNETGVRMRLIEGVREELSVLRSPCHVALTLQKIQVLVDCCEISATVMHDCTTAKIEWNPDSGTCRYSNLYMHVRSKPNIHAVHSYPCSHLWTVVLKSTRSTEYRTKITVDIVIPGSKTHLYRTPRIKDTFIPYTFSDRDLREHTFIGLHVRTYAYHTLVRSRNCTFSRLLVQVPGTSTSIVPGLAKLFAMLANLITSF